MTFCGSGSADPNHWLTDPDHAFSSVADKMPTKKSLFFDFLYITFWRCIYISLQRWKVKKNSQNSINQCTNNDGSGSGKPKSKFTTLLLGISLVLGQKVWTQTAETIWSWRVQKTLSKGTCCYSPVCKTWRPWERESYCLNWTDVKVTWSMKSRLSFPFTGNAGHPVPSTCGQKHRVIGAGGGAGFPQISNWKKVKRQME